MILEYFSLEKSPFTGPGGRLEKSLNCSYYLEILASCLVGPELVT